MTFFTESNEQMKFYIKQPLFSPRRSSTPHANNGGRYGIRKVWEQLRKEGYCIACCRVARLMQ